MEAQNNQKEDNQEIHSDESFDRIEEANWSPFDEGVKERSYTKPHIGDANLDMEIPEPQFKAPSLSDVNFDNDPSGSSEGSEKQNPNSESETQFNPTFHELPKKEKAQSAEVMADVVLDGYGKLKGAIGSLATISESKLEQEYAEGTIDPNLQMPIDNMGNTMPLQNWVTEFNNEAKDAFKVDPEFKEKIKPPLVRVFQKRGIGMTDEQNIAYLFGTELVQTGVTAFALRKSVNQVLSNLRDQTEYNNSNHKPREPQPSSETYSKDDLSHEEKASDTSENIEYQEPPLSNEDNNASGIEIDVQPNGDFLPAQNADNMPKLGDPEILEHMAQVANSNPDD